MTREEMIEKMDYIKEFLNEELRIERGRLVRGEENHYSYLFMLMNDLDLIER